MEPETIRDPIAHKRYHLNHKSYYQIFVEWFADVKISLSCHNHHTVDTPSKGNLKSSQGINVKNGKTNVMFVGFDLQDYQIHNLWEYLSFKMPLNLLNPPYT